MKERRHALSDGMKELNFACMAEMGGFLIFLAERAGLSVCAGGQQQCPAT